jgi:hypothetical protein
VVRTLLGLAFLLIAAGVGSAAPPTWQRVMATVNVPPRACDTAVASEMIADALVVPLPALGFVHLPVEVWRTVVTHTPPNAPAGAPKKRDIVRLFTLAGG